MKFVIAKYWQSQVPPGVLPINAASRAGGLRPLQQHLGHVAQYLTLPMKLAWLCGASSLSLSWHWWQGFVQLTDYCASVPDMSAVNVFVLMLLERRWCPHGYPAFRLHG